MTKRNELKKETYTQQKTRHQKELNDFPLGFAFDKKQFEEMRSKLGAKSNKDLVSIGGGGFLHRNNLDRFNDMISRHDRELKQAMRDENFAYQAISYELGNHEFGYTYDAEPALRALGLTYNDVESDDILKSAYNKAVRQVS